MNAEALLGPLPGAEPCGPDLSFSREFDAVRESRRADDPTLAQGEWKKPLKAADWDGVATQCEALLARRTKDLRVAGWLTEALAHTAGFAGLADGLGLVAGLCERWWDAGLHPLPVDGDAAPRVGSLDWLLGHVAGLARTVPILRDGERGYGLRELDAAQAAATAGDDGAATLDDVSRAEAATPPETHAAHLAALRSAVDALARLQATVDARLGVDGPSFVAAGNALDDALRRVARHAAPGTSDAAGGLAPVAPPAGSLLQTRAQALQQLRAVADFFRRNEPHSPVAYLADKAAAWGEMPLHVWLRTVLKDPGALGQVEELLGLPRAAE